MTKPVVYACLLGAGLLTLSGLREPLDEGPSPAKTPAQELATFQVEPGLTVQLVAAEPMVQDPVTMTFDEDGRLWVVEMRGFMPTIDGAGENQPTGRVSVLEDRNGDGQMDVSTVYADSLVMPRAIALVPHGALIAENGALWLTEDRNGDLKADTKTLIDKDYAGSGLPEHAGNGLWRGIDNWYYNAKSRFRYRLVAGKPNAARWQRDSTEFRGQWGISHDDKGRLVYNYNWSQLHADLVPPNYLSRNKHHKPTTGIDQGLTVDRRIYPIRPNPAVNRGYIAGTLDKDGRLLEFTAACSPLVYRAATLPKEYAGNIFVCEPAGNLIKRNVIAEDGPIVTARDPHPGREFLASTDERFRPVSLATGPDGALYVADMYRGLVQHAAYITPYLKEQTLARNLVLPVHRGRIWRVVPTGWRASKPSNLSEASSEELVKLLSHPNGWHRDVAQRLLIERNDTSVRPLLTKLVTSQTASLGRFHALWTLDGLNLSQPDVLFRLLSDKDPLVRNTALRLLEPFAKTHKSVQGQLIGYLSQQVATASAEQSLQMALSVQGLSPNGTYPILAGIVERHGSSPLMRDAVLSSLQDREWAFLRHWWQTPQAQKTDPAGEIFAEMLTTAIVRKRDPGQLTALLTMLDMTNGAFGGREKAILSGLSIGAGAGKQPPIQLAAAPRFLSETTSSIDPTRRQALNNLFTWPGQIKASPAGDAVASGKANVLSEEDQKLFATGRQLYLSTCSGCHGTDGAGMARFAPPLIGSDWVVGDGKRLALILLHGMEGPVDVAGKIYNAPDILPVMPAHSTMDDGAITAILTYIRNEWGNQAGPVGKRVVGMTRVTSQGRVMPWTAKELNKYVLQAGENGGKQSN